MNEVENILTFGNIKIDVANVIHRKEREVISMWTKLREKGTKEELSAEDYYKEINKMGYFLIKQNLSTIRRRKSLFPAIVEYIKRLSITPNVISNSLKGEYKEFHNWISIITTGLTLEENEKKNEMEVLGMKMYSALMDLGYSPDQCVKLLLTFVEKQDGQSSTLKASQDQ
jgi:hypothetical protein